MLRVFFILTFLSFANLVFAQNFPSQMWHKGYLVNAERDTIRGKVKYDMDANSVQVMQGQKLITYSSHNSIYFKIFDVTVENYREFYAIPYEMRSGYKSRYFFELQYEGPLTLLSREKISQESISSGTSIYSPTYIRDVLVYDYFFLDNKGNVYYFSGKKNDLLSIMSKKQREVKQYLKDNNLRTDQVRDLIRITAFYNSI